MILTVLRPPLNSVERERGVDPHKLANYVAVNHVMLHGTFGMHEILPETVRARLARFANDLENAAKAELRRRRHEQL